MLQKKELMAYGASIVYSCIFGLSFIFTKSALEITTPLKLISFRFLLAFLTLSLLIICRIVKVNYKGKNTRDLLVLSMIQPVAYFLFETYGVQNTSTSYAGLLISLIPVIVTILAIFMLKEIPNKIQVFFIILSVAGVIYILLNDNASESSNSTLGAIFIFIAVLASSIYNILSRKSSVEFTSVEITYFMMGTGAIVFNLLSVIIDLIHGNIANYFEPLLHTDFLIAIAYLGILSSVLAFFCINYSLGALSASKASIFGNLATVIAIVAGVVVLKEDFYYYHVIGSVLIILGIIGTNYFNTKSIEEPKEEGEGA